MQEKILAKKFEQNSSNVETYHHGTKAAQLSFDLGKTAMLFSHVERVPRYADGERENNAEHSFMLALVAPEISEALELPYDPGLISQFAIVHDLIELKTGDVATLLFTEDCQLQKELTEQAALRALIEELPPHTGRLLERYEAQAEPEARFVRYVDKLLPIVIDCIGEGSRVMEEDYGVTTADQLRDCRQKLHARLLRKFGEEFPELDLAHALLCELFEQKFAQTKH